MAPRARDKTVVVGAGPVGALAALYAARRGDEVAIYELRGDLRDSSTTPLNFTKSINLALSERGINSMRQSGCAELVERIIKDTIPMYARMVHGRDPKGELSQQSQQYDIDNKAIRAVDRTGLNTHLLDELEKLPNVTFHFHHKLTGADYKRNLAWFQPKSSSSSPQSEVEIPFTFLIGADGAHSSVRYHLMKYARIDYAQSYISSLWCEFRIPQSPSPSASPIHHPFLLSPNHLHIWPGGDKMFIAIPSLDHSFTCTLFLPSEHFTRLADSPSSALHSFFAENFPGVSPNLISPSDLEAQFNTNPHLPLISIKTTPYHYSSSVVILGDAAHAMVPFYGQGMNAGLEDVRVLYEHLDRHPSTPEGRASALQAYTTERTPDAHAINDLAMGNYEEMAHGVVDRSYRVRKAVEEWVGRTVPALGWRTQYSRVSFGNERYSVVKAEVDRQGRLLVWGLAGGIVGVMSVVGAVGWRLYTSSRR